MKLHHWESLSISHLRLMRFLALIPLDGKTFDHFVTKLLAIYAVFVVLFFHSTYTWYGILRLSRKVFEADAVCEMIVAQGIFFRYFTFFFNRDQITKIVDISRGLWRHLYNVEENETVRSFERKAYRFRNFLLFNLLMIGTSFYVTFFVLTASIPKDQKPLVFRFYVEVHTEPWYTTVMIVQFVVVYTIAVHMATMEGIGLYMIMMACGYLRVIRNRLLILTEGSSGEANNENEEALYRRIVDCVKFHQNVMLYCREVEWLMSKIYMINVLTTVYNISIIGIKLLENGDDKFIYMIVMTNSIFTFFTAQWAPEHLLAESEAIGDAAYCASHESRLGLRTIKTLLMMIIRSQKPVQITAGGIMNLSIETFGAMLKNAFSFFAVLRSFAE